LSCILRSTIVSTGSLETFSARHEEKEYAVENLPHISKIPKEEQEWFQVLANLARYLRSPEGCPWDQQQTARSFAGYLAEEAAEYVEALDAGDPVAAEEEFGDVLFVLLASMACAEAEGRFNLEGALRRAHEKMVRRHDHVFGSEKASTPEEAIAAWNRIKAEEKGEA